MEWHWEFILGTLSILVVVIGGICKLGWNLQELIFQSKESARRNDNSHKVIWEEMKRIDAKPIPPPEVRLRLDRLEAELERLRDGGHAD